MGSKWSLKETNAQQKGYSDKYDAKHTGAVGAGFTYHNKVDWSLRPTSRLWRAGNAPFLPRRNCCSWVDLWLSRDSPLSGHNSSWCLSLFEQAKQVSILSLCFVSPSGQLFLFVCSQASPSTAVYYLLSLVLTYCTSPDISRYSTYRPLLLVVKGL